MDLVTQDNYEKRRNQSTITIALVKEEEIKQELIQKLQTRRKQETRQDKNKNTNYSETRNNTSRTPLHKCLATTVECDNCHKTGYFARVCRSNTDNAKSKRINYLEEINDEVEKSEHEKKANSKKSNKPSEFYQLSGYDKDQPSDTIQVERHPTIERKIPLI